jgi:hypothetical protein
VYAAKAGRRGEIVIAPYLRNALWVLGASIVLPVVGGVLARLFFLRRDADDIALHPGDADAHAAKSRLVSHEPEPEPAFGRAWSEKEPRSEVVADAVPGTSGKVRGGARVIREYRAARLDTAQVASHVNELWERFVKSAGKRPEWTSFSAWSGGAPYQLAGAQGGSAEATTLSVSLGADADIPPEVLAAIWDAEILPGLRRQFGTRPFRYPAQ